MKRFLYLALFLSSVSIFANETPQTIKPLRTTVLEEKDNFIKVVTSISVSPNGKTMSLLDESGLFFSLYNTNDGKLRASLKTSDTLNKCLTSDKSDYWKSTMFKSYFVIDNETGVRIGALDLSSILNDFLYIHYLSDSNLLVGGTLRALAVDTATKNSVIMNIGGYFLFGDSLNLIKSSPFEADGSQFSLGNLVYPFDKNTYIVYVHNYMTNNPDSSFVWSLFDSEGKNIKSISLLPQEYGSISYTMIQEPRFCKVSGKFFWTTTYDYKIRHLEDTNSFELKGFDSTNYYFCNDYKEYLKPKKSENEKKSGLWMRLPIFNLDSWQDSLLAVHCVRTKIHHVQFYDVGGNLKNHFILEAPQGLSIISVAFASQVNKIFAVTKDEENYYLTEYIVK